MSASELYGEEQAQIGIPSTCPDFGDCVCGTRKQFNRDARDPSLFTLGAPWLLPVSTSPFTIRCLYSALLKLGRDWQVEKSLTSQEKSKKGKQRNVWP